MEAFDFLVPSFQSSLGKRKTFKKEKYGNSQSKVRKHSIVWRNTVRLKSYTINAFVMGYHVYKNDWTPSIRDQSQGFMKPTNKPDKYAVAVKGKDGNVIGHLPLGKSRKKDSFLFFEVWRKPSL